MDFSLFIASAADAATLAAAGGAMVFQFILSIIGYLVVSFSMYTIAKNQGVENAWFAFVPILNIILLLNMTGKELWWIVLFLIPCVNLVVAIIVLMKFAEVAGKPSWWGILLVIPCVNLIAWPMMAFSK